ncbi:MAG TPA: DNA polymerase III subunit delta' C-terminal domain-containing protein, partial [Gammaproteobacteria bacterium]
PLQALELAGSDAVAARAATFDGFAGVLEGRADPLSVAASWAGDAAQRLRWAAGWMVDLARLASVGEQAVIDSPDLAARLHPLAQRIDLVQLFNRLDQLQESRRLLDTQVNTQLLCEQLLLDWDALARRPGA